MPKPDPTEAELDDMEQYGLPSTQRVIKALRALRQHTQARDAVVEAAKIWHKNKRPIRFSDAEWADNPIVNCTGMFEPDLARALAALDKGTDD